MSEALVVSQVWSDVWGLRRHCPPCAVGAKIVLNQSICYKHISTSSWNRKIYFWQQPTRTKNCTQSRELNRWPMNLSKRIRCLLSTSTDLQRIAFESWGLRKRRGECHSVVCLLVRRAFRTSELENSGALGVGLSTCTPGIRPWFSHLQSRDDDHSSLLVWFGELMEKRSVECLVSGR